MEMIRSQFLCVCGFWTGSTAGVGGTLFVLLPWSCSFITLKMHLHLRSPWPPQPAISVMAWWPCFCSRSELTCTKNSSFSLLVLHAEPWASSQCSCTGGQARWSNQRRSSRIVVSPTFLSHIKLIYSIQLVCRFINWHVISEDLLMDNEKLAGNLKKTQLLVKSHLESPLDFVFNKFCLPFNCFD